MSARGRRAPRGAPGWDVGWNSQHFRLNRMRESMARMPGSRVDLPAYRAQGDVQLPQAKLSAPVDQPHAIRVIQAIIAAHLRADRPQVESHWPPVPVLSGRLVRRWVPELCGERTFRAPGHHALCHRADDAASRFLRNHLRRLLLSPQPGRRSDRPARRIQEKTVYQAATPNVLRMNQISWC